MNLDVLRGELSCVLADARRLAGKTLDELQANRNSARFTQAVAAAAPNARVAFGVGRASLAGWICTDVTRGVDMYLDLTRPWPVRDGSVARAYGDNVIEHFSLEKGREVLGHCHRALVSGGKLRLSTPDLERAARAYLDKSALGSAHLRHYEGTEIVVEHPVDLVRMLFAYNDHWAGYLYDEEALTDELVRSGFSAVRRWEPGESDDPAFQGLESRTGGSFQHFQLVLEATR